MADGIYSAVPRALGESRRTLRDIMTDMANTRALEAKINLTQGAQRGNLEIAKLESDTGLAKFQADSAFRSEQLAETTRHHKAVENIAKPEAEFLGKTDTLRNWILKYPAISSAMKEVATKNMPEEELNQNMTGYEAKRLYDSLSKNPAFFYRNLKGTVIDKLDGIMAQLQDEAVPEAERKTLYEEQYAPLHGHLEKLDLILGSGEKIKDDEMEMIRKMAIEAVKESDGTLSVVDAMNEYLEATKQIRKAVHGGGKIFPDSLEEIMGKGATPGSEAGAGDKGSWKTYDTDKPEKKETKGMITPGNIDLNNRPVVQNPDGSVSTELSISIGTDKGEVLIPRVINGRVVSPEEAKEHYEKTGEHLGIFKDVKSATDYANVIHNRKKKKGPSLRETTRAPFTGLQDVETFQGYKSLKDILGKVREKGRTGLERMAGRGND